MMKKAKAILLSLRTIGPYTDHQAYYTYGILAVAYPGWGGGLSLCMVDQATGLVSPLHHQICLKSSLASLRSPSDRSGPLREPSQPTRKTGFRQI